jgi:hypothetical protein
MDYKRLNIGWKAEPNAPDVWVEVKEDELRVEFYLNPFVFDNVEEGDKGELTFKNCFKFSFNSCNEEGYYLGQYRYKNDTLPWGEFYELFHDWESDFHNDFKILNSELDKHTLRHFLFFFRDNTLECIAKDFEFRYCIS